MDEQTILTAQTDTEAVGAEAAPEGQSAAQPKPEGEDGAQVEEKAGDDQPAADAKEGEGGEGEAIEYGEFTVPEGVELNQEVLGELQEFGKENQLQQEQVQRLVDLGAKLMQSVNEQREQMIQSWVQQSKSDKEFGGDKFDENAGLAKAGLDKYASDGFKRLLVESGYGNHPEVIRTFLNIGRDVSEDRANPKGASGSQGRAKSVAEILYGQN